MNDSKGAFHLTVWVIALMALQSAGGLLFGELYRDNVFVRSAWLGNDWVTFLVALPLLAASTYLARRGSSRARLIWLGGLAYGLYNYAFYLFGAALNAMFLSYVALFTLCAYALILGLKNLDVSRYPTGVTRVGRAVSGYMFAWAILLGALWIFQSLQFAIVGTVPAIVTATAHPTNVTAALDLSIMVPAVFLGAVLLWKGRPWGFVLAVLMNVKGAIYAGVLAVSSGVAAAAGILEVAAQIPLWVALCLASTVSVTALLRGAGEVEHGR